MTTSSATDTPSDKLPEEQLFDDYLAGAEVDPTEHDQYTLEKFHEILGDTDDEY